MKYKSTRKYEPEASNNKGITNNNWQIWRVYFALSFEFQLLMWSLYQLKENRNLPVNITHVIKRTVIRWYIILKRVS